MKRKNEDQTASGFDPDIWKWVIAILLLSIGIFMGKELQVREISAQDTVQPINFDVLCDYHKPMGDHHTLCVIYEEQAGSLQDLIEWNRRMQSVYVFGSDNSACFWDRMAENTPEYDLEVALDTSVQLPNQTRWLIKIKRGLLDVDHLILLPNDGTSNCPADQ